MLKIYIIAKMMSIIRTISNMNATPAIAPIITPTPESSSSSSTTIALDIVNSSDT